MWVVTRLKYFRTASILLGICNILICVLGGCLMMMGYVKCGDQGLIPVALIISVAAVRILVMIYTGIAQEATAMTILKSPLENGVIDAVLRNERRIRYKRWLMWARFTMIITVIQFIGAAYLAVHMVKSFTHNGTADLCLLGMDLRESSWKTNMLVLFVFVASFTVLLQCFAGSDVLRWRSYYETEDDAWKAHYREVFDHGMREFLCCMGRVKYMRALEEDEVYSVARLLGDLVAYRASGTGHLELLAGLALFKRHGLSSNHHEGHAKAPRNLMEEAASLHKFAEAAYTGPLLDIGRNPFIFPCAWLYRQGILCPWSRIRRPSLENDNWWRGHAAAFLKYVNLPSMTLRRGRVCQGKCQAAYFVVILHHARTIVITVRGTETPEDLITDGLCKACPLSAEDLDGLVNCSHINPDVKQNIECTFPHYGHSGIVKAARELYQQVEGNPVDDVEGESTSRGFLSMLVGPGCECDGYDIRIVGHSLGGSIATLLGLRLYCRFPNLHVYAFGSLPCVDSVVADACSHFVTSIIYDNEFSACLSVGSVLRLRAAAIMALSQDPKTDTTLIFRLARRFLYLGKHQTNRSQVENHDALPVDQLNQQYENHCSNNITEEKESDSIIAREREDTVLDIESDSFISSFADDSAIRKSIDETITQFMEIVPKTNDRAPADPEEMFLAGLIIHIVPRKRSFVPPVWKGWILQEAIVGFDAYLASKEQFMDIVVSPSMFLDHLPWKCISALQKILNDEDTRSINSSEGATSGTSSPRIGISV